jgi:hypothetical protein
MQIKPIVEAVAYALEAKRWGQTFPPVVMVMDARNGPIFIPHPKYEAAVLMAGLKARSHSAT